MSVKSNIHLPTYTFVGSDMIFFFLALATAFNYQRNVVAKNVVANDKISCRQKKCVRFVTCKKDKIVKVIALISSSIHGCLSTSITHQDHHGHYALLFDFSKCLIHFKINCFYPKKEKKRIIYPFCSTQIAYRNAKTSILVLLCSSLCFYNFYPSFQAPPRELQIVTNPSWWICTNLIH